MVILFSSGKTKQNKNPPQNGTERYMLKETLVVVSVRVTIANNETQDQKKVGEKRDLFSLYFQITDL